MFKTLLIIYFTLFLPVAWTADKFEVPRVRVLVVSGKAPSDGQIRVLRSATARNYTTNLLRVEKPVSEVEETIKYLENIPAKENEILFLTPSDTMLLTQEVMIYAFKVSQVALMGGGTVVMPYPKRNESTLPTKYDDELADLEETLEFDYAFRDNTPRPTTYKQWKASLGPYAKLKYLQVKVKQEQRKKALINDYRFCALTGLTIAVKESLKMFLENPLSKGNGSLTNLCEKAMIFGSLRHELQIILDSDGKVFSFASDRPKENMTLSYAIGHDGSKILYSYNYVITPVIFDSHDKMPFDLSNMASGEIAVKSEPCKICPDNEMEDLEKHFGSIKNYPVVQLIVVKSSDILGLDEFITNLKNLTYPKEKIVLSFVMSYQTEDSYVKKILTEKSEELGKLYLKTEVISALQVPALTLFEKMWEKARTTPSDYLFIVDPVVRFSDLAVIEHLLKHNRRMISPLLKLTVDGFYSFVPDRNGNELAGNAFAGAFQDRTVLEHFDYRGLLQIPFMLGALMIRSDVVNSVEIPFQTCFYDCEDNDEECRALNMKNKEENCKTNYYGKLNGDEHSIWGMMCKQIQEQGIIPFISNAHDYGHLIV